MKTRRGMGIAALLALAGAATAQVTTVAFTTDDAETEGNRPTDCNIGVDNVDSVLIVSNMRMSNFDKAGVMTKDANTQWRIFGAHTVRPDDAGSPRSSRPVGSAAARTMATTTARRSW